MPGATQEVEELTRVILTTGLIPPRATRDAAHIALAAIVIKLFLPCVSDTLVLGVEGVESFWAGAASH